MGTTQNWILRCTHFRDFRVLCFWNFDRDPGYIFSIPRARAAASWGRVGPRDATASARATRNPAYAGPGFWLFISLWTQCPGQKRRPDSESAWKTGLETSFGTDQNKKKKLAFTCALHRTVPVQSCTRKLIPVLSLRTSILSGTKFISVLTKFRP